MFSHLVKFTPEGERPYYGHFDAPNPTIYTGFPKVDFLVDGNRVSGVIVLVASAAFPESQWSEILAKNEAQTVQLAE